MLKCKFHNPNLASSDIEILRVLYNFYSNRDINEGNVEVLLFL